MEIENTPKEARTLRRYRIPCRYHGGEYSDVEAKAFLCGAISAVLGTAATVSIPWENDDDPGEAFIVHFVVPPERPVTEPMAYVRTITALALPELLDQPTRFEIGDPEDMGEVTV